MGTNSLLTYFGDGDGNGGRMKSYCHLKWSGVSGSGTGRCVHYTMFASLLTRLWPPWRVVINCYVGATTSWLTTIILFPPLQNWVLVLAAIYTWHVLIRCTLFVLVDPALPDKSYTYINICISLKVFSLIFFRSPRLWSNTKCTVKQSSSNNECKQAIRGRFAGEGGLLPSLCVRETRSLSQTNLIATKEGRGANCSREVFVLHIYSL